MTLQLYPYQVQGSRFLSVAGSALLADEMGTGKTVQAIATIERDELYPALVVCPTSVKGVWLREFRRWAPRRTVLIAPSSTAAAEEAAVEVISGNADALVVGWEQVRNLSRLAPFGSLRLQGCEECDPTSQKARRTCQREDKILNSLRWAVVVADEAHRGKEPKAQQTRALWAVGDKAEHRYALTGTPIANSAEDLWSVMRFVAPDEYPAKWAWIERYANTVPNVFSGGVDVLGLREDRREELDRYFLPRFLRRTKKQVLPFLPPKVYERRDVTLSGKQLKAYKQMEKEMAALLEGGAIVATNSLTSMLRLRQLASAYGEVLSAKDWSGLSLEDGETIAKVIDQQVRLSEPSSKLDVMEEVLEELGPRQVVIFAESRQLIELAAKRLDPDAGVGIITGEIDREEREQYIDLFQQGKLQYMLLTTAAGSEGITLTAADTAIFLQRPWSAVQNQQAEDRLHRIGQEGESVLYIDLVSTGTIEEHVIDVLEKKRQQLQQVVRDAE